VVFFGFLREDAVPLVVDQTQSSGSFSLPKSDAPAPGFGLPSLSGESIHLEDYRGKVVLLNFWATWCAPCRLEMPTFQSRYEDYADDMIVVAVNNAEDPEDVRAFVDEFELTFEVLLDPESEVQYLYKVSGYPTTLLIDPEGIIRVRHIGLISDDQLDGYLQELGIGE
jgi:peroxiredoxin